MLLCDQVRNESAEDFLLLLKEWKKLCDKYARGKNASVVFDDSSDDDTPPPPGEFEVEKIIGIRRVDGSGSKKSGVEMKVRNL